MVFKVSLTKEAPETTSGKVFLNLLMSPSSGLWEDILSNAPCKVRSDILNGQQDGDTRCLRSYLLRNMWEDSSRKDRDRSARELEKESHKKRERDES